MNLENKPIPIQENSTAKTNQTDKDYLIRMKAMRLAITKKALLDQLKKGNAEKFY